MSLTGHTVFRSQRKSKENMVSAETATIKHRSLKIASESEPFSALLIAFDGSHEGLSNEPLRIAYGPRVIEVST